VADITHAMLGPSGPEVDCDECFRLLDQYAEHQHRSRNAAAEFPQLAAHLDGCPVCQEELESLLALLTSDDDPPLP
jgi:hypothetical protein